MRYGKLYQTANISGDLINDTLSQIKPELLKKATVAPKNYNEMLDTNVEVSTTHAGRTNSVSFIDDIKVRQEWLTVAKTVNKDLNWNFDLTAIEPIQYGEYAKTQEYSWHVDQHNKPYSDGMIRKISFSVFLNDDYEGGEFDLEIGSPKQENRLRTFAKLPENQMIFFQSDFWHQVRPVTKGVRKSLVGWVLGPKFK